MGGRGRGGEEQQENGEYDCPWRGWLGSRGVAGGQQREGCGCVVGWHDGGVGTRRYLYLVLLRPPTHEGYRLRASRRGPEACTSVHWCEPASHVSRLFCESHSAAPRSPPVISGATESRLPLPAIVASVQRPAAQRPSGVGHVGQHLKPRARNRRRVPV